MHLTQANIKKTAEVEKKVGKSGTKNECLGYIKEIWIDMRPKSLKDAEATRATKI